MTWRGTVAVGKGLCAVWELAHARNTTGFSESDAVWRARNPTIAMQSVVASRGPLSRAPLEGAFGAPRLNVALARLVDLWNDLIAFATLGQGRVLTCPAPVVYSYICSIGLRALCADSAADCGSRFALYSFFLTIFIVHGRGGRGRPT